MSERDEGLTALLGPLASLLRRELVATPELAPFLELLASLQEGALAPPSVHAASALPVVAHLAAALALASGPARELADGLETWVPALAFVQNPNYRAAPPSPNFLDNYGYAVIAGPRDGPPALQVSPMLAFGLLLLGPHTEYPLHHHPASEVYAPLGEAEWLSGASGWQKKAPGSVIHHAPHVEHATRTGDMPLAALYLWRGDLDTHARLR
jgi:hypothetical protein